VTAQLHAPAALPPGEEATAHTLDRSLGSRAVLDDVERRILGPTGTRTPTLGSPARSRSLCRLETRNPHLTLLLVISDLGLPDCPIFLHILVTVTSYISSVVFIKCCGYPF
jgi:hypothetical protein